MSRSVASAVAADATEIMMPRVVGTFPEFLAAAIRRGAGRRFLAGRRGPGRGGAPPSAARPRPADPRAAGRRSGLLPDPPRARRAGRGVLRRRYGVAARAADPDP